MLKKSATEQKPRKQQRVEKLGKKAKTVKNIFNSQEAEKNREKIDTEPNYREPAYQESNLSCVLSARESQT